jgi:hypothetical protein
MFGLGEGMEHAENLGLTRSRIRVLHEELVFAVSQTSSDELKAWAKDVPLLVGKLAGRRARGVLSALGRLLSGVFREIDGQIMACTNGRSAAHFACRVRAAKGATWKFADDVFSYFRRLVLGLRQNPRHFAPKLFVLLLGFYIGSGGLDGDGGIPDLDLKRGIGSHRSILTHSIVPAIVIEAAALSLLSLVMIVYSHLPRAHDIFWDRVVEHWSVISASFVGGACAGIAYHLLLDMNPTSDSVKAYADLPFSTSVAGHKLILGMNAVAEAIDLKEKDRWGA